MITEAGIGLAVLAVLGIILYFFIRTVIRVLFIIIVLFVLMLAGLVAFTLYDRYHFNEQLDKADKLFLYEEDNRIIAGFGIASFSDEASLRSFTKDDIGRFNRQYQQKDFAGMRGSYSRLFILKEKFFDSLGHSVNLTGQPHTKEYLLQALREDDVHAYLIETKLPEGASEREQEEYRNSLEEPEVIKAKMLAIMFTTAKLDNGQAFIMKEFKKKNIIIYPKSAYLRAVRILPASWTGIA